MEKNEFVQKPSLAYRLKKGVVGAALIAFGATFEKVSKKDEVIIEELKDWEEGLVLSLGVLPFGPAISMKKKDGYIKYLGRGYKEDPSLKILFKNVDSAFLAFTGQMGNHTAFAQHRALVHGSLIDGIKANRVMGLVQTYLLPGIVLNKIFKRPPKYTFKQLLLKGYLYLTFPITFSMNMWK
jgi:hypothetical protein